MAGGVCIELWSSLRQDDAVLYCTVQMLSRGTEKASVHALELEGID